MGAVLKKLCSVQLPEREKHQGRIFVDLAENIHLHYREYRFVFSLNEFFEFASILAKSTEDIRGFLEQNPEYREGIYPDAVMIAGGKARQLKFLANSPAPHRSAYFDSHFAVELQEPSVIDEIHIHYRDFRLAMSREHFKAVARAMGDALQGLERFEDQHTYVRQRHPDREFTQFNQEAAVAKADTMMGGVVRVPLSRITSHAYGPLSKSWQINRAAVEEIKRAFHAGQPVPPVPLTMANAAGEHTLIDGHHRVWAAFECGHDAIDAVLCDLTFEEAIYLRHADVALKRFDEQTTYRYGSSSFLQRFIGYRLNRFHADGLKRFTKRQRGLWRWLRLVKRRLWGPPEALATFEETRAA